MNDELILSEEFLNKYSAIEEGRKNDSIINSIYVCSAQETR